MPAKLIIGNWKMNTVPSEGIKLLKELLASDLISGDVEVGVAPPFTHLAESGKAIQHSGKEVWLCAQNMHQKTAGAYTGEVGAGMLKDLGVDAVIIGHSERREYFGESHSMLAEKLKTCIEVGLRPVFCIGEPDQVRSEKRHKVWLKAQIEDSLGGFSVEQLNSLVIAYEPVWAIGTGNTATPEIVEETHSMIRYILAALFGASFAEQVKLLYGGSVNENNASELMHTPGVDGALVGGASLKATSFLPIIQAAKHGA